jgi:hypothetical protein
MKITKKGIIDFLYVVGGIIFISFLMDTLANAYALWGFFWGLITYWWFNKKLNEKS